MTRRGTRSWIGAVAAGLALVLAAPVAGASAGWLDPSFGRNGTVDIRPRPEDRRIDALDALRSPRGVVVLSQAQLAPGGGEDEDGYYVHALTSTGGTDRAFDPAHTPPGLAVGGTPIGRAWDLVARPGGFLVVANTADSGFSKPRVIAYRWDGTVEWVQPEPTLSPNRFGAMHGVVLPDGRIRVCATVVDDGFGGPGIWLVGLLPNGQPDPSVGGGVNVRKLELGAAITCNGLEVDSAGRLIVAGSGRIDGRRAAFLGRFDAGGEVDGTFGSGGHTALLWSAREFTAHDLVRLGTQGWLLGGQSIDPGAAPLAFTARFTADGAIAGSYGYGGVYRYPGGAGGSVLRSLDGVGGDLAVMGIALLAGDGSVRETLQRFRTSTGRLDPGFGRNGVVGVFHEAVETVPGVEGRTVTVGSRVGSSTSVLVQGRHP